jgi:hypothetical protein
VDLMQKLTYFIDRGNDEYESFYEYTVPNVGEDELYARQLCTYLILNGNQYQLISNEMQGNEEILVIHDLGPNEKLPDELLYQGQGLHVEFRRFRKEEQYRLISRIPCHTHFDVIRYLLKDVIDIPGLGQFFTTSTELDEDRGVYVLYVKNLDEEER